MNYTYLGYTEERQIVKGKVSATDEQAATAMLTDIGYRVLSLKPITTFLPNLGGFLRAKVKSSEMVTFSRQLALLLESGVGVIQALELLSSQTGDKTLNKVLTEVVNDLRGGKGLSTALAQHPHVFSTLYCKLISVGEQTGSLEAVLRSLADYSERQAATTAKIKQALMYPAIVFCLAIGVAAVMLTVLLPPLIDMFSKLGGTLPLPTRILLAGMGFLESYGVYLFVVIIALGIVGFLYSRTPNGRYLRDRLILRLPLIGRLSLVSELARSCRSMSLLFRAGLPLPEVMALTTKATGNRVVARALSEVEQDMLRGQGLAKPMSQRNIFLPLMVEMTKVGEETGNLDDSLIIVAENYEIEAERRTQTMLGMIEPAMTIAMGLGVGFLALSVFMPIYGALGLIG
ncbi:MAG: pilus assembly protein [Chloroflexi bacterium RBG_13_50_10]|nr:MAG: pilus assembly protein [Chloroflexi bacterium RBG_13_50_10]